MSAQAQTEKKQQKRKRSSKSQQAADVHARKRYKTDRGSTASEQSTAHVVNGTAETQQHEAVDQTESVPELDLKKEREHPSNQTPLSERKRKRKFDAKDKKTNGVDTQPRALHDGIEPIERVDKLSPQHDVSPKVNKGLPGRAKQDTAEADDDPGVSVNTDSPQITVLEKAAEFHSQTNQSPNGVPKTKSKKSKWRQNPADGTVSGRKSGQRQFWNMTEPLGGHFLQQDPIFSPDERYIIIGHPRAVHIYSVTTSVFVRTLPISELEVTAFVLSSVDAEKIYIAAGDGVVFLWSWVTGHKLGRWELQRQITGLWTTVESRGEEDIVITVEKKTNGKQCVVAAHRLGYGQDSSKITSVTLFDPQQHVQGLKVLSEGKIIIAFFQHSLAVGQLNSMKDHVFEEKSYVWREIDCINEITSYDARISSTRKGKAKDYQTSTHLFVDVAIGTTLGSVFIYSDILNKAISHSQQKENKSRPSYFNPKRFHWHREAVGTVKWSKDGNYLISGGKETVLVLWQLETSKTQFLPHLTSEIESLVVSPSGAAYAVRLADNSLMVLSTSELKPKTHVAGIQVQALLSETSRIRAPQTLTTLYNNSKDPIDSIPLTPAAFSPLAAHKLLLAVPSCLPRGHIGLPQQPASYLQTFDVATARHVARQALARNNVTSFNKGPEGNKLEDPNIKLMRISCDGKWLATVDEWIPPMLDTDYLAADTSIAHEEQLQRREIYLKFWRLNGGEETWMLETRVDVPHLSSNGSSAGNVDDLASDPERVGFSTVGEDGVVRIWRPRTMFPNNRLIWGVHSNGAVNWACQFSIRLQGAQDQYEMEGRTYDLPSVLRARLAYSSDGSALSACQSSQDEVDGSLLHLIDTDTGNISYMRTLPTKRSIIGVGFLERHFVVLSDTLIVWDPVEDGLVYGYDLELPRLSTSQKQRLWHIAANPNDGTFALALSQVHSTPQQRSNGNLMKNNVSCNLLIFRPISATPVFTSRIQQLATALIPGPQSKGYAIVDSNAEIRFLTPNMTFSIPIAQPIAGPNESLAELEELNEGQPVDPLRRLLGEGENDTAGELVHAPPHPPEADRAVDDGENDNPVVRSEKLAEALDVRTSAGMPSVQNMFDIVVGLFAKKPRTARGGGLTERQS